MFDKDSGRSAATEGLQSVGAGPSEEIEDMGLRDEGA